MKNKQLESRRWWGMGGAQSPAFVRNGKACLVKGAAGAVMDELVQRVQAVLAGNDLLCCTDFEVQIPAVLAAVEQGVVPETRVDEAVRRVLTLKQKLGLFG